MTKTTPTARTVPCPTCRNNVTWAATSPYRPFCSERCKLIDIGAWADESYRVAGAEAGNPDARLNDEHQE